MRVIGKNSESGRIEDSFDRRGTNYKRIDFSRSFPLRPNDRFIKIAKFYIYICIFFSYKLVCMCVCMYVCVRVYLCEGGSFFFLYNHIKFRDGAQVDRVSYIILQNVATQCT